MFTMFTKTDRYACTYTIASEAITQGYKDKSKMSMEMKLNEIISHFKILI